MRSGQTFDNHNSTSRKNLESQNGVHRKHEVPKERPGRLRSDNERNGSAWTNKRSGRVAPSGQSCSGHVPSNQLLQFPEMGVRRQYAVCVRVPGDQERNPVRCVALKKKDGLLGGRSKEIASLKTQTERGAGHLRDEQFALGEPGHIPRKYFLRSHAPVRLPSVFADQVARKHFGTPGFRNEQNFLRRLNRGTTPGNGEAQINFHDATEYLSMTAAG